MSQRKAIVATNTGTILGKMSYNTTFETRSNLATILPPLPPLHHYTIIATITFTFTPPYFKLDGIGFSITVLFISIQRLRIFATVCAVSTPQYRSIILQWGEQNRRGNILWYTNQCDNHGVIIATKQDISILPGSLNKISLGRPC